MLSDPSPRTVSAPERARRATKKVEAMTPRTAVRNTGGKSGSATLLVTGNVPHRMAINSSATCARV